MIFNSLEYLLFLLLAFALFWSVAGSRLLRTVLLLVASYVFYMSWNATYIVLIVASTVLDFFVGRALFRTESPRLRKALLCTSLAGNLGVLGLFKYFNFGVEAWVSSLALLGVEVEPVTLNLILPVGISFYTFQTLSYTLDIYRRRLEPTNNFLDFATFVAFFPQLVAGPIVRARELLPQFEHVPRLDLNGAGNATFLIAKGMVKKVLVADFLAANWIDRVWEDPGAYTTTEVWLACFAYTWQIYADFSGYTDIARGSAKLFGFELPENFHRPFNTTGPIDFWSKWHITLSSWIRDYIYIPLGGSRNGRLASYRNLFITFLLAGIWHGAGWTFVIFGVWHGMMVAANRWFRDRFPGPRPEGVVRGLLVALNLFLFVVHWPMFRSSSLDNMLAMYQQMFAMDFSGPVRMTLPVWGVLLAFAAFHMTPPGWLGSLRLRWVGAPAWTQAGALAAVAGLLVWVGSAQQAPFIYFQF